MTSKAKQAGQRKMKTKPDSMVEKVKAFVRMPRSPRSPVPELTTCETDYGVAYGWKCDKHGILSYGNTKLDAVADWHKAYDAEYFPETVICDDCGKAIESAYGVLE